jgi:integrase
MPKIKITKSVMSKIQLPASGRLNYWDTDLAGFGVRATKENLTFVVYRRVRGEKEKTFIKIGRYGEFSPEQARQVAKDYIRRMELGENPDPKKVIKVETITVKDLYRQYLNSRKTPLAPSTIYQYESWMKNHFKDWEDTAANAITAAMVLDRLTRMENNSGKVQAANAIKLLRGLYRFGMALYPGVIAFNPVEAVREIRGREWAPRTRRQTYIAPDDFPGWFRAVNEYHNPKGRDYILMLLYTGLRRNEAATMRWDDIDFRKKTYTFSPEKKRGEEPEDNRVTMPMSEQLHRLLLKRRAEGWENEYIFPGKHPSPHISNPDNWKRDIIKASGVRFCFHDLRRTFITIAESLDIPHYALKAMLNHSMGNDVTGGYICMSVDRLRGPVQQVADRITELATTKTAEEREAPNQVAA